MDATLINTLSSALNAYRQATLHTIDEEAKGDFSRLAAITDKIIASMQREDIPQLKIAVLGFSRQVSDSFSVQPTEFRLLAETVAEVKRLVL
jgi:hypothetical protein